MGLFKRKTRATRKAEARAIKAKAKLEAKLAAKNEARRIKADHRAETNALKAQLRAQRDSDRAALKVADLQLKAAREGKLFSPTRIRRLLTVTQTARTNCRPAGLPRLDRRARFRRRTQGGPPRCSAQPDRAVLRPRRAVVGADRRCRAVAASGGGEEAEGCRDQAVRGGDHRTPPRSVGGGHRGREHAGVASSACPRLHRANNSTVSTPT